MTCEKFKTDELFFDFVQLKSNELDEFDWDASTYDGKRTGSVDLQGMIHYKLGLKLIAKHAPTGF